MVFVLLILEGWTIKLDLLAPICNVTLIIDSQTAPFRALMEVAPPPLPRIA